MRFGLLGTGHWAAETQAAALAMHPDAEFVGVWGRDESKAEALATRYAVTAYREVDALFADVAAVAVALPPDVQAPLAARAAEAGRHLLLDKPLALSAVEADRVVDAVDRQGLASVVFFTNRFYANVDTFLRQAAARGGWHGARATMLASIFQPGSPYGRSAWRRAWGGLWDVGPHALSVILPVLGPVVEVAAMAAPYDTSQVLLRHATGAVSGMALSLDVPPSGTAFEFVFFGNEGVVPVPAAEGTAVEAFGLAIGELVRAAAGAGAFAGGSGDRPAHPCDVRFGRDVVAILEAAGQARQTARTVRL
jgi:predicted dehydrogenase